MANEEGTGAHDEADEYDAKHGHTSDEDAQRPSKLTETGNKPPPQAESFRITTTK